MKSLLIALLCLMLLAPACLSEASMPPVAPSETPIPTPKPTPAPTPLARGAKGDDVRTLQTKLREYGFWNGESDGVLGAKSEAAIKEAQAYFYSIGLISSNADGYEPDGVIDSNLRILLLGGAFSGFGKPLRYGDQGTDVKRLQYRLNALGYLDGGINEIYGDNTISAISYFQKMNGLPETGLADEITQRTLFSENAVTTDNPVYRYYLKISVKEQRVYAYEWKDGAYTKLEREMICSTGIDKKPTPKGVFESGGPVAKWCYFPSYGCWAQYAFQIDGSILFHSVLYSEANENTLRRLSVKTLGQKASHGCVRLGLEDAKWIYDNCRKGTTVEVY